MPRVLQPSGKGGKIHVRYRHKGGMAFWLLPVAVAVVVVVAVAVAVAAEGGSSSSNSGGGGGRGGGGGGSGSGSGGGGGGDVSCLERYRTNVLLARLTKVRC